jgi:hypothetical protein
MISHALSANHSRSLHRIAPLSGALATHGPAAFRRMPWIGRGERIRADTLELTYVIVSPVGKSVEVV